MLCTDEPGAQPRCPDPNPADPPGCRKPPVNTPSEGDVAPSRVSAPRAASRKRQDDQSAVLAVRRWERLERPRKHLGVPDPGGLKRLAVRLFAAAGRDATAAVLALPLGELPWATGRLGYDYDRVAADLAGHLHRVEAAQPDAVTSAAAWAKNHWPRFVRPVLSCLPAGRAKPRKVGQMWRRMALVAAVVYRLGRLKRNVYYVVVARDRIAESLGERENTVGGVLRRLHEWGVIEFKLGPDGEPEWDRINLKARMARYIAEPPGPWARSG